MSDEIKPRTVYMLCRKDKKGEDGHDLYIGSIRRGLWKDGCRSIGLTLKV